MHPLPDMFRARWTARPPHIAVREHLSCAANDAKSAFRQKTFDFFVAMCYTVISYKTKKGREAA